MSETLRPVSPYEIQETKRVQEAYLDAYYKVLNTLEKGTPETAIAAMLAEQLKAKGVKYSPENIVVLVGQERMHLLANPKFNAKPSENVKLGSNDTVMVHMHGSGKPGEGAFTATALWDPQDTSDNDAILGLLADLRGGYKDAVRDINSSGTAGDAARQLASLLYKRDITPQGTNFGYRLGMTDEPRIELARGNNDHIANGIYFVKLRGSHNLNVGSANRTDSLALAEFGTCVHIPSTGKPELLGRLPQQVIFGLNETQPQTAPEARHPSFFYDANGGVLGSGQQSNSASPLPEVFGAPPTEPSPIRVYAQTGQRPGAEANKNFLHRSGGW